ncbi:Hypothetical predicted protein, partial [Paramuricea clavata]
MNGFISSERLIKCGVPQGSILGPLLFLLYINDLPECLNITRPQLFADDTNLTASGDSMNDAEFAVNSDLENLRNWLIANKLSLNVAKTEFMLIGSKRMIKDSHPNIFIENKQIKQVYECKTLGIIVDQHLSWKSNTKNICKKITAGISALRRIKPFVDKDTLISIYNTIVRPHFDYCCEVWDVLAIANENDQESHGQLSMSVDPTVDISVPEADKNTQEHLEHRQCTMCKEAWPARQHLASEVFICCRCKRDKKSPKKFSAENDMDPGTVPEQLRGLTQ